MSILAQPIPARTPRLQLLLRSFRAAALDAAADIGTAVDFWVASRTADKIHDRSLAQAIRAAALGAQEAEVRGCACGQRLDRVRRLVEDAQRHDAQEDSLLQRAWSRVGRAVARIRTVAAAADRLLSGRTLV